MDLHIDMILRNWGRILNQFIPISQIPVQACTAKIYANRKMFWPTDIVSSRRMVNPGSNKQLNSYDSQQI